MAITSAEILTYVNDRLGMTLTDIDTYLMDVLEPLSKRGRFIPAEADIAFTDGEATVACPTDYLFLQALHIEDHEPMDLISIQDYNWAIRNQSTISEGIPTEYAVWNKTIYPYPVPDDSYTGKLKYYKLHAHSATVAFDDRFRNAIQKGVTAQVAEKHEMWELAKLYTLEFEAEVAQLRGIQENPGFVKYHDI